MNKIVLSIVFLVSIVVGGYFADSTFKAKVDGAFGRSTQPYAAQSVGVEPTAITPTNTKAPVPSAGNDTLAKMLATGTVTASVMSPSKPFYTNDRGHASGFNIDFMTLMFDQGIFKGKMANVHTIETDTYAAVPQQLLTNATADLAIDGLTFNDQDLNGVVYTIPYVTGFGYSLITKRGATVQGPSDLVGGTIGILKGDPDVRAFAEGAFPGAKLIEIDDRADSTGKFMPKYLNSSKVDAIIYDYPFAVAELENTDLQFAMTKIEGSEIQYRIGVRKNDKPLLIALNAAIRAAVESPAYVEMLKRYFVSDKVAAVRRASSGELTHIVEVGETLSTIAKAALGNSALYTKIQQRNNIANPNFITIGQRLVIPQ